MAKEQPIRQTRIPEAIKSLSPMTLIRNGFIKEGKYIMIKWNCKTTEAVVSKKCCFCNDKGAAFITRVIAAKAMVQISVVCINERLNRLLLFWSFCADLL